MAPTTKRRRPTRDELVARAASRVVELEERVARQDELRRELRGRVARERAELQSASAALERRIVALERFRFDVAALFSVAGVFSSAALLLWLVIP